jgi:mitochondrial fission protein ELM1
MNINDFTTSEQKQINAGLSTAEITDKEAADKILALVPQDWIKKIPFFVRKHATTKTIERIAHQYPELYAVAKKPGELPEKEREELRGIITGIFKEKMAKHNIK